MGVGPHADQLDVGPVPGGLKDRLDELTHDRSEVWGWYEGKCEGWAWAPMQISWMWGQSRVA